jgi:ubiquinone/menaquinone biosynthesis C-methylase UbiE
VSASDKRTHRHEKLARIYDDEILPIWSQRFGRMILRGLEIPPKAMVLDVGCATGYPALEIARRMDEQSRLVAIDASSSLLDVARRKAADLAGRRIFFRTERYLPRLPFAADVFDVVVCNLGLPEAPSPSRTLRDFARVAKPGGRVIATMPLHPSWQEFHDLYREVLVKHDQQQMLERLDKHLASLPDVDAAEEWMASAGLEDARVDVEEFTLLFRSAREFFFAPVVEYGPLPHWKAIAGRGQELQDVFWHIKEAIDAYFGGRAFQITILAGCLSGSKSATGHPSYDVTGPVERESLDTDDEALPLSTAEVELVEDELHEAAADILEGGDELDVFRDEEPAEHEHDEDDKTR